MQLRRSFLVLLVFGLGCDGSDRVRLDVLLLTDYRPTIDFVVVRAEILEETSVARAVSADESFTRPSDVARLDDLRPERRRRLRVSLLRRDGTVLQSSRTLSFRHLSDAQPLARICAACEDFACPLGQTCECGVAPTCVPDECDADDCAPTTPCTADVDCGEGATSCVREVCREGACLRVPDDDACPEAQLCDVATQSCARDPRLDDPDAGSPGDAGVDDGGGGASDDAGVDGAVDAGPPSCDVRSCELTLESFWKSASPAPEDLFGHVIRASSDGSLVAVGAPGEDAAFGAPPSDDSAPDVGAVYVFRREETGWTREARLQPPNARAGDEFGFDLALSSGGDRLLITAPGESSDRSGVVSAAELLGLPAGLASGAVYSYRRAGTSWELEEMIKAPNPGEDFYGYEVALSSDEQLLAVSAILEDSASAAAFDDALPDSGAVYLYGRLPPVLGGGWVLTEFVKAPNAGGSHLFGYAVSVASPAPGAYTLAVGARDEPSATSGVGALPGGSLSRSGAAYVFESVGGTLSFSTFIKAPNPGADDFFGGGIALSDDASTLVVMASREDSSGSGANPPYDDLATDRGAVYVYRRVAAMPEWSFEAFLKPWGSDPTGLASIGLSEDGNTLAFGAILDANEGSPANSGAVYVWSREPMSEWTPARFLKAPRPGLEDFFGWSISLTESSLFVTALRDDTGGSGVDPVPAPDVDASGAAFAFSLTRP
jgi:hypothetical protein